MPKLRFSIPFLLALLIAPPVLVAGQTGIQEKKPVFGGACKICPWGTMAEVVKEAMQPYGYDVQICYNCNAMDAPRIVSEARMPPPYKPDHAVPEILAPRNVPGLGAVDFGAVAIQFLRDAYRGTGIYRNEKPRTNLRLIANIQDPSYVLVAAKADTGITDLSQIREKRWPIRILTAGIGRDSSRILAHFGLSKEAIEAAGGHVGNTPEDRENFDVVIGGGGPMTTAPEWSIWTEISQKFDLRFIELPEDLLAELAREGEQEPAHPDGGAHGHRDLRPGRHAGRLCLSRRQSHGRAATALAVEAPELFLQRPYSLEGLRSPAASGRRPLLP